MKKWHSSDRVLSAGVLLCGVIVASVVFQFPITHSVRADVATTTVTVSDAAPVVSAVSLNGGSDITLVEYSSVIATTTFTVSDANGCSDISAVEARLYRTDPSTTGTQCAADDNNCYNEFVACAVVSSGNTCSGGADTSADYECAFRLWYVADPTDSGAFASDIWAVAATATDSGANTGTATNSAETIEVNTLLAHDVTATIAYGSISAGANTGVTNQIATITNTGNAALDTDISGVDMCTDYPTCAGDTIAETQQKYDLSDETYGSLSFTLSDTPTTRETVLGKPTATTTDITDDTFWGIAIPSAQASGSYTGVNTFTAVAD